MANETLIKSYVAEAAIAAYRIVKPGAADTGVIQGAAAADFLIGVANRLGGTLNDRVEVAMCGIAEVEFGGTVTRGGPVTSDASGKAVAAAPAAGANNRIIGFALESAVLGDVARIVLAPGQIQG